MVKKSSKEVFRFLFIFLFIIVSCREAEVIPQHETLVLDTIHFDAFIKVLSKRVIGNYAGDCYIEDTDFFQGMLSFEYDTVNNSHLAIKELYKSDDGVKIIVEGDCLGHTQFYVSRVNFKQDSIKDTFIMGPHRWDISIYYNEGFVKTGRRTSDTGAPSYTKVDGYFYKE